MAASKTLKEHQAQELCIHLLQAESEEEIRDVLVRSGLWDEPSAWCLFGDNENNFAIIGNQQSNPVAAMVEKLVNAVDAVLMRECYLEGVHPESPDAPQSIAEALERYFDVKDGNLANVGATRRSELASNIGFVATGRRHTPNYIVFDHGEGQTPEGMPSTFLSLAKSNKLRIPFVQGKFNMGGTGVLQFCGKHNLQLIISRRLSRIADDRDPSANYWGFTIIRREDPTEGRRSSVFTYLAPGEKIPRFRSQSVQIPETGTGTQPLPALEWGTIIKMFEYEMTRYKSPIVFDLWEYTSLLLPRAGLPIRFFERRDYGGHTLETTMAGLHVRLEEDKRDNIEDGFPTVAPLMIQGQAIRTSIYAFRKGKADSYRKEQGILFSINGQTHGILTQDFFRRRAVGMAYLADSLLVIVECDGISGRMREDLFMNSRDRLRSGELRSQIERILEELLREHRGLRELREQRRREEIEGRLADARPLRDILKDVLRKSPALAAFLMEGKDLGNPFKSRLAGEQKEFEGERHPSYFRLRRGEESKTCHIDSRFRVQFETDAMNDYFGRDIESGRFVLHANGQPTEDYVLHLWHGIATLTVTLPADVEIGDELYYDSWVEDETLIEPYYNAFKRYVDEPLKVEPGRPGTRRLPAGPGNGHRQLPDSLSVPEPIEVREDEWKEKGFDKYSAMKVIDTGEGGYDFFVNMDNVYLRAEIKALPVDMDVRLLEARFKYGLALIGLALLKDEDKSQSDDGVLNDEPLPIEERILSISRTIAPILLPMIATLGDLQIEDEHGGLDSQTEDTVNS